MPIINKLPTAQTHPLKKNYPAPLNPNDHLFLKMQLYAKVLTKVSFSHGNFMSTNKSYEIYQQLQLPTYEINQKPFTEQNLSIIAQKIPELISSLTYDLCKPCIKPKNQHENNVTAVEKIEYLVNHIQEQMHEMFGLLNDILTPHSSKRLFRSVIDEVMLQKKMPSGTKKEVKQAFEVELSRFASSLSLMYEFAEQHLVRMQKWSTEDQINTIGENIFFMHEMAATQELYVKSLQSLQSLTEKIWPKKEVEWRPLWVSAFMPFKQNKVKQIFVERVLNDREKILALDAQTEYLTAQSDISVSSLSIVPTVYEDAKSEISDISSTYSDSNGESYDNNNNIDSDSEKGSVHDTDDGTESDSDWGFESDTEK